MHHPGAAISDELRNATLSQKSSKDKEASLDEVVDTAQGRLSNTLEQGYVSNKSESERFYCPIVQITNKGHAFARQSRRQFRRMAIVVAERRQQRKDTHM